MTPPRSLPLIYVVGPSGAGKDSLLAWLTAHWPGPGRLHTARRTITRPVQAGGEAHEPVTAAEFDGLLARGAFALHWAANSMTYGIRHEELAQPAGSCVCVNGSREHLASALVQWPGLKVLHVTAPLDVLAQRLQARGREAATQRASRLVRSPPLPAIDSANLCQVCNDGPLEEAGSQALAWLLQTVQSFAGPPQERQYPPGGLGAARGGGPGSFAGPPQERQYPLGGPGAARVGGPGSFAGPPQERQYPPGGPGAAQKT